jgi:divalent metal cation (Fe/Co/Zn/Cd) transporter
MSRLIGESLAAETMESIRKILDDHPMAKEIVELLTRYLGGWCLMGCPDR